MQLPAGIVARPVAPDDLAATVALLNAATRACVGADDFTPAMLRKAWSTPGFDPAADTRLLCAPDGALVGYAELWWREPGVLSELWASVAPGHGQRARLADALLAWGETRARERNAAAPPGPELLLHVEADAPDEAWLAALARAGYRRARTAVRLERELRALPPPSWPAGLEVRALRRGVDERAAWAALRESFRDHWGYAENDHEQGLQRFLHWMAGDPDFDPALFWLAWDGDAIAGFLFAFPACEAARDVARIPSLGVRRAWRRRGLARALLLHALVELARRGLVRACIEADGDSLTGATALYRGVGMVETRRWITCEKVLRPGRRAVVEALAE